MYKNGALLEAFWDETTLTNYLLSCPPGMPGRVSAQYTVQAVDQAGNRSARTIELSVEDECPARRRT